LLQPCPTGRQAFAEFGKIIVTHGGVTIDEMIVPLVELKKMIDK